MFFPKLTRRSEDYYHHSRGAFYADYTQNYSKISEDCQHRCVYCDVLVNEVGGEGMQLDHFRPQHYFNTLTTHPHNLYLACAKCNQLKTNDWPCPIELNGPSFVGSIGYIDAFTHDPKNYLTVNADGQIVQIAGPVNYMILKMDLNRLSRTQIRRRRLIEKRKNDFRALIDRKMDQLCIQLVAAEDSEIPDIKEKCKLIMSLTSLWKKNFSI